MPVYRQRPSYRRNRAKVNALSRSSKGRARSHGCQFSWGIGPANRSQIGNIKTAFRLLLQSRLNTAQAVEQIKARLKSPEVQVILDFIETADRGVIK